MIRRGVLVLLGLWAAAASQAADAPPDEKRRELDALRRQIGTLEETLGETRGQREGLVRELEAADRRAGELARAIRGLETDISAAALELDRLQAERARREGDLALQRAGLRRDLRAAYLMGRQERLKLMLSQEDPALLSRVLAYYEYLSRARAARVKDLDQRLEALREVERALEAERQRLEGLRGERERERGHLGETLARRRALVAELDRTLREQHATLGALRRDAEVLETLILRLEQEATVMESAQREPIAGRKGSLPWPVDGRIGALFGTPRGPGGLLWDAVVLNASEGTEVRAVHHGRVAFADWLRGFGLLIILDHGDGVMTLYGFNQSLLKETGEWVDTGEPIALVGDSGARRHPALYFGLRRQGRPENPREWCRAKD